MAERVLIVDDEKLIRWALRERLSLEGYQIEEAESAQAAERLLQSQSFDLALFDLKLPDGNGLDLLRRARQWQEDLMVLIITAHSSVDSAVEAMKQGAFDYLSKPFNMDEIALTLERASETRRLRHRVSADVLRKKRDFGMDALIGESPAMRKVKDLLRRVAATPDTTVLLLGETGSGKDLAARAIHYESARAPHPFMNITCTAMPETLIESELFGHEKGAFTDASRRKAGLFELAHGGTVFLDEIGDMPQGLQARLLRVLEEKSFRPVGATADIRVDCRLIAATHRNLPQRAKEGLFREDLYYRLNTIPIVLPPLRERPADISVLARHFLTRFNVQMGGDLREFTPEALEKLSRYPWPGNIRELRNVIERAVFLAAASELGPEELLLGPASSQESSRGLCTLPPEGCRLADVERSLLEQALQRTGGNQTQAAELLGLTRDQVRYKLEKHGLK